MHHHDTTSTKKQLSPNLDKRLLDHKSPFRRNYPPKTDTSPSHSTNANTLCPEKSQSRGKKVHSKGKDNPISFLAKTEGTEGDDLEKLK